ncbi:MAG: hypothetical protein NWF07_09435 [Candidatus Bathyarchaeota archaeon]|nr:hypothetical protein [Candidatus Bathyarchaeota archaeon]
MAFAQSITVTDYTSTFEEWDDSDWYDGVIENMGETTVVFPDVTISYYDEEHTLIHSKTTSAELSYLGPGEKTPFTIIVDHMNFTSLEFSVESSSMNSLPYRDFSITEVSRGTDIWGLNTVAYDVKNTGEIDLDQITLYGIHFDANGDFLDYSMSYLIEELASGETVSIELDTIPLETADSYLIIDVLETQSETLTGSDTTTSSPTSNTDAEPDSGGGIPGFPVYGLLMGILLVTILLQRKPTL